MKDTTLVDRGTRRAPDQQGGLSPMAAILLPIACGLAGGYLDLAIIVLRKYFWNGLKHYANAHDFPWTVPVGHAVLLVIPGVLLALICRFRPKRLPLQAASWLFATLSIWGALLRLPLYGVCSLLLAAGVGARASGGLAAVFGRPRRARQLVASLVCPLIILAAASTGWRTVREYRTLAGLPAPSSRARNVVFIVWDTVRAANLSLYGYPRNTTPNLARWAQTGVRYNLAVAPAPWTFPSHASFFTGYWPFQLISQSKYTLDAPVPTLAEYLAAQGYLTAGFSANTLNCSYESRLDRGFAHFEDYPLTPWSFLGRTVAGSWILENIVHHGDFYETKWARLQSRNAGAINRSFLDWLEHRQRDRPFFAYLNYFDAHDPYIPPPEYAGRFGIKPRLQRDYQFLFDYGSPGWKSLQNVLLWMARDCYDDCIAYIDGQLGQLLDKLHDQGLLDNTIVIITSDHGESFGEHGLFLHGVSLYLDEIAVPLVILSSDAPAGRVVTEPVSLRDLPATVVDRLGLTAGSAFPGHSLAAFWSLSPGQATSAITPVLSEHTPATAFQPTTETGLRRRDVQMSLVAHGRHYIRDGLGAEQLYDLGIDRPELVNLIDSAEGQQLAGTSRGMLLDELNSSPGSVEAEYAYLKAYRQWLQSLVISDPRK